MVRGRRKRAQQHAKLREMKHEGREGRVTKGPQVEVQVAKVRKGELQMEKMSKTRERLTKTEHEALIRLGAKV